MARSGKLTKKEIDELVIKLGGKEIVREILRIKGVVDFSLPEAILIGREKFTVGPLNSPFLPGNIFQTIEGLSVSPEFTKIALSAAKVVERAEEVTFQSWDIACDTNDFEIRDELPEDFFVELWQIGELIEKQWVGQEGPLLTNGFANLFYLKEEDEAEFVIRVRRSRQRRNSDRRSGWALSAWWLGGSGGWPAGGRIFTSISGVLPVS